MSHSTTYHAFVFTWNNYTAESMEAIDQYFQQKAKYYSYAQEVASTGTPHLQGNVWLLKARTLQNLMFLSKEGQRFHGIHFEVQLGNMSDNYTYIVQGLKKGVRKAWVPDTLPTQWGEAPSDAQWELQRPRQGQRMDLEIVVRDIKLGKRTREIFDEHLMVAARFPNFVQQQINYAIVDSLTAPDITLRPWQNQLVEWMRQPRVHRKIYWVWSAASDIGKTTFADWLYATWKHKYVQLPNMKWADIADCCKGESPRIIHLNLPREPSEDELKHLANILEKLSDGGIPRGPKYGGGIIDLRQASVLVTANIPPPLQRLPKRFVHVDVGSAIPVWFIDTA